MSKKKTPARKQANVEQWGAIPLSMLQDPRINRKVNLIKVFAVLSAHQGSKDYAFPGLERIAELSGVARGKVSEITRELAELGYIEKVRRGNRANIYRCLYTISNRHENRGEKEKGLIATETVENVIATETVENVFATKTVAPKRTGEKNSLKEGEGEAPSSETREDAQRFLDELGVAYDGLSLTTLLSCGWDDRERLALRYFRRSCKDTCRLAWYPKQRDEHMAASEGEWLEQQAAVDATARFEDRKRKIDEFCAEHWGGTPFDYQTAGFYMDNDWRCQEDVDAAMAEHEQNMAQWRKLVESRQAEEPEPVASGAGDTPW